MRRSSHRLPAGAPSAGCAAAAGAAGAQQGLGCPDSADGDGSGPARGWSRWASCWVLCDLPRPRSPGGGGTPVPHPFAVLWLQRRALCAAHRSRERTSLLGTDAAVFADAFCPVQNVLGGGRTKTSWQPWHRLALPNASPWGWQGAVVTRTPGGDVSVCRECWVLPGAPVAVALGQGTGSGTTGSPVQQLLCEATRHKLCVQLVLERSDTAGDTVVLAQGSGTPQPCGWGHSAL